jgi:FkbM family methyltransferase
VSLFPSAPAAISRAQQRLRTATRGPRLSLATWLMRGSFALPDQHQRLADEEDLAACYRILLGRAPDPDGWSDYTARLGRITVDELVQEIIESREFRRGWLAAKVAPPESLPLTEVDVHGMRMLVSAGDAAVGRSIFAGRDYEPHVTEAVLAGLGPGSTFLDIGCNIGWFVLHAARAVGSTGRVIGVEAAPHSAAICSWNACLNGFYWVDVHPFGADAEPQSLRLERWRGTNAQLQPGEVRPDQATFTSVVHTFPLDDVLGPLDRLDVVKLDIEGAEGRAVRGAAGLLETHRPVVCSEYSPIMLEPVSGMSGREYLAWFTERGWDIELAGRPGETLTADAVEARSQADPSQHLDLVFVPR